MTPPNRAVNLPLPSMAGQMRGGEGKRGTREEAKEKENGLLIPIGIIMEVSAGVFFCGIRGRNEIGDI